MGEECRDANEDHGKGFDDIGCDKQYKKSQINKVIPEDDDICWEISRFGFGKDDDEDDECKKGGESCESKSDCCSKKCKKNLCKDEDDECKEGGELCEDSEDCCSEKCKNGTCKYEDSGDGCNDKNEPCEFNEDCCSGKCKKKKKK